MKSFLIASVAAIGLADLPTLTYEEINALPGITWTAGPRVGNGISKKVLGVKPEAEAMLMKAIATGLVKEAPAGNTTALPVAFDSETNWPKCAVVIGDIRDQSNCGCCWAFAAAEAASDRLCINTNAKYVLPLSAQETCFCAESSGCDGGDLFTPWSYIKTSGLVTGGQYEGTGPTALGKGFCSDFSLPHCHHHGPQGNDPYPPEGSAGCPAVNESPACPRKCDSNATAPHNVFNNDKYTFDGLVMRYPDAASIAQEIMTNGPVECAFTVYSDFENYVSGVYKHVSGQVLGGHAVKIVGWGVDGGTPYWKIANSWNPYWGENGYFRIVRGSNECGVESQVTASSTDSKWSKM